MAVGVFGGWVAVVKRLLSGETNVFDCVFENS